MTTQNSDLNPHRILATDDDLHELLLGLLHDANQRQLWLIMLDAEQRIAGPFMPIEDLPLDPRCSSDAPDMPGASAATVLFSRFRSLVDLVDAHSVVLVWERRGPARAFTSDLDWAKAARAKTRIYGPRIRAQFLLHDTGLRLLTPDELS